MEKNARLAFRILASLYPDRKPSEIKKIIADALKKKECPEDVELWMVLTKDALEDKKIDKTSTEKKVIEEHHYYHHYDYSKPWYTYTGTITTPCMDTYTITCDGNDISLAGDAEGLSSSSCCISASSDCATSLMF